MAERTVRLEAFSYLPALSAANVATLAGEIIRRGSIPVVEHTERPGPRATLWEMWKIPLFDARSVDDIVAELDACAAAHPRSYVRLVGHDPHKQTATISVVVRRPVDG